MDGARVLLIAGVVLLSIAALLGFVQERYRDRPHAFAAWRVVHAGGTAGAVQLLVLAALWQRLAGSGLMSIVMACTLSSTTWAFFLGPLAHATGRPRLGRVVNIAGAALAIPGYGALPFVLLL
jgi:hypothetical protein